MGQFVPYVSTPEPSWYQQAWGDRYRQDNPNYNRAIPPGPNNPQTAPLPAPPWPTGGEIIDIGPFEDVNADTYEPEENRRFFQANAGGTSGMGFGWVGCEDQYDPVVLFETGDLGGVGFEQSCNHPILPEEEEGVNDAPVFFDGWVEHDDLPSSKYHRAGDQRLGEVTSPFNNRIWGHDRGPDIPGGIPNPNGIIPAAGPYATDIHGNYNLDGGNLLTMELLTWCLRAPCVNNGVAWEHDLDFDGVPRYHPYAGPSGENLGFRDYNLDGLVDLGESRFGGSNTEWSTDPEGYVPDSANYIADPNTDTGVNNGVDTHYPFNRLRLIEDCIEVLDRVINFNDWVDPVAKAAVECNRGRLSARIPKPLQGSGNDVIYPDGVNSGIVLLPADAHGDRAFGIAPEYHPIHNEDGVNPNASFPQSGNERVNWNLFFHNLCRSLNVAAEGGSVATTGAQTVFAAHEYFHTWEGYPDLYDYEVLDPPQGQTVNTPIGYWDIMAYGGLVHSVPILKEKPCTEWIKPVDLTTVLTPGVETTLTLPPYESVRDKSAYFLENENWIGERYYFWSAGVEGSFDEPGFPGFGNADLVNGGLPGTGMLIMHTDVGADPGALPAGQTNDVRFQYLIVQADGLGELEAGTDPGDDGDPWPGSTNATRFSFDTVPPAEWYTQNSWTGIDVRDVVPDGHGAVQLKISWVPTSLPSLRFVNPPGGSSVNSRYRVNFDATDVFGGTTIEVYYTQDPNDVWNGANLIDSLRKTTPGTNRLSVDWYLSNVPDGQYYLFAKLIPGIGAGNRREATNTAPRAGRNNHGDGTMTVSNVNIAGNKARLETWTAVCVNAAQQKWAVSSTLSQPILLDEDPSENPYPRAVTGIPYTSIGGEVTFTIHGGSPAKPFVADDTFVFTTTGTTAPSGGVTVAGGEIRESPTAVILAAPLWGPPPLRVSFDGRDSVDPNGETLQFRWTFGDGSAAAVGSRVQHTYARSGTFTARLRVTNPLNARFGEASVDIEVTNNSPNARISADPTSGPAELMVDFDASRSSDTETEPDDLVYQWDFGDGGTANNAGTPGILIQKDHLYIDDAGKACTPDDPCTFTATLTVTDEGGKKDTDSIQIHVGNTAPVVSITYTALRGTSPHEVIFNAINSTDAEDHAMKVDWFWGDGESDLGVPIEGPSGDGKVPHIYTLPAGETSASFHTFAVVTDEQGASTEWPGVTVTVSEMLAGPSEPFASFTIDPDPPILNEPFTVDGRLSFDRPDGGLPARFVWDWGDNSDAGSGSVDTHTYTQPGSYTITLTVYDDEDPPNMGTRSRTVQVAAGPSGPPPTTNRRPTAVINVNQTSGIAGVTEFVFDGRSSTDLDGDQLTYSWNIGGSRVTGPVVARVFEEPGQYTITLTVTDTSQVSDDTTVTITVRMSEDNRPPFAFIGTGPRTGAAPLTLTFNGQNSYDPDGDPITFTWEFLRGDSLITSSGPTATYVFSEEGEYSVILEVSDGRGGVTRTDAEVVRVTARAEEPRPDDGDGDEEPEPYEIPDSANQRTGGLCGLGMVMSFFGSLVGLSVMRLSRRRFRI